MFADRVTSDEGAEGPRRHVIGVLVLRLVLAAFVLPLVLPFVLPLACTSAENPDRRAQPQPAQHNAPSAERAARKLSEAEKDRATPRAPICPAELEDAPAVFFEETLLLRLPKGVSEDNFVELGPNVASLVAEVESVGCIDGLPGGLILSMTLIAHDDRPDKELKELRDEALESMGFTGYTISEERVDAGARFYQAVLDGAHNYGEEIPTRILFQMKAAHGTIYTIVYETHVDAWSALQKTFRASASRIVVLSR